ncbi:MAG TPA: hypothetical protein VIS47_01050 [Nitrosopumilus sp.]
MSLDINELTGILNEVRNELANQISLTNSENEKIDIKKLSQKAHELDRIITASRISDKDKLMLQKFSATLLQDNTTVKSLRYLKQDLERIFSNLEDLIQ